MIGGRVVALRDTGIAEERVVVASPPAGRVVAP
jgi:hypothetical protein